MTGNYTFALPTRIEFGVGVIKTTGKEAKALGATKVMLVADKGVIKAGLTLDVEKSLVDEGIPYIIFDKIVPNPKDIHCEEGYEIAKRQGVDVLVAVGGGSSMDTAKAIGTLLTHGGIIQDWCGFQLLQHDITPLIAVPTTAGSGSEVTPFAVITDTSHNTKINVFDPKAAAKVALIDPTVLLKLPSTIMAPTGIDALTHAIEAYTCKLSSPYTDACALYAMKLIQEHLREAVRAPDINNCAGMILASNIAGIAFGYSDVAAVHCMAEALGGKYDIPHGVANAILLPTVMEFNLQSNLNKYAEIAMALGVHTIGMSLEDAAKKGIENVKKLCKEIGIVKMKEISNIDPKDFPTLAKAAEKNVSTSSNPRKITCSDYLDLFIKAYEA